MTQEDKQLLLKDLCARLPYGVNLHIEFYDLQGDGKLASRDIKLTTGNSHWVSVKPYLRPMESMTEEEADEFEKISNKLLENGENTEIWNTVVDWLNAHYFDHRGLISMGLPLEAPKDMYIQ